MRRHWAARTYSPHVVQIPAQHRPGRFELAGAVVPHAAGGHRAQVLLGHGQPVGRREWPVERVHPQVPPKEAAHRGHLRQVIDGPLVGAFHEHRAGGAIDFAQVGRQAVHLERQLGGHDLADLLGQGQTVSLLGSAVTRLALPLTAVLILGATQAQMGVLVASQTAPMLLIGLVAGVWVDRVRRRPLLIATDLGQAVLLGWIPFAATLGVLRMEQLYVVGFLVGCLVVVSGLAGVAYLAALVGRGRLVAANSRLTASESVAQIAGPSVAGDLVQTEPPMPKRVSLPSMFPPG